MTSVRTFTSRTARLIVTTLVATIACAVVAPNVTPVKAAGAGIIDYYATLNGSSHFRANDTAAFDLTSNVTAEMWVRPGNVACVTGTGACQLMNKENAYQFGIRNGVFQYALTNSGGTWDWYATDTAVRQGVWQHIAFVVSRTTNTIRFYYNGELSGDTLSSTSVPSTGANSSGAFTIGNRSAFNEFYTGDIDEVRLYSEARTQANIRSDMYTYGTTNAANLVAYYDFNGASNTLVNDVPSAASGTDLTASGTVTWTDVKTVSNPATLHNRTIISFPRSYITSNGGWTVPAGVTRVDALVVAGGGGGGGGSDTTGWSGGGGGAGGLRTLTNSTVTPGSALTLAVGGGGHRGNNGSNVSEFLGTNGAASIFGSTSTVGGGRGGMNNYSGANGGSGGGAGTWASNGSNPGTGTTGEGTSGGASSASCCAGGGGGGAGGAGGAGSGTTGGAAGNGLSSSITGTATFYAGGGAGYGTGTRGAAGSSGGVAAVTDATTGTGSGGGGGAGNGSYFTAGFGGSGVVIVSYASPVAVDSTNRSRQFAGTAASKITVPDNNALDVSKDYTIEAWVFATSSTGAFTFINKEGAYILWLEGGTIKSWVSGGGTGDAGGSGFNFVNNAWNHVAVVKSGTRVSMYRNGGVIAGGQDWTGTGYAANAVTNTSVLEIGGRSVIPGQAFPGYLDDVRIWSYARSASAIAQNYNKRVASDVLYFPFDESVGTNVANYANSTGSALNGTSVSTTIAAAWPSVTSTYNASNISGFLPGYDYHAGSPVTFAISQNGAKGTATVSASTGAFSYEANPGATGNDTFTYSVTGANGTATHTYTVTAPSQPMASARSFRQASDVVVALNSATSLGYNNPSTVYTLGETVRATVSVTNGVVNLTQGSTTIAAGAQNSAFITIDGSQSQINTALNSATVTATSPIPTRATLDLSMKPGDQVIGGNTYTWNSNGHYYTRITPSGTPYATADSNAKGMTLGGRPGYLATIQHSGENTTITGINGSNNSYVGGSDRDLQGTYRWKGNDTNSIFRVSPNAFRNRYTNFASQEPNGENGSEDWVEIRPDGLWNDCQDACNRTSAIVEFDPMSSRTVTNLDFARSLTATAASARNLGLGSSFLNTSTWANGEIVRATFTASAGTVAYTASSTTIVSGASGSSTVTFEGTVANMNTALNTATVTPSASGTSTVSFTYGVKRATTGSYVYNAVSDHFYFSNTTASNYSTATSNSANAKWAGTSGYLVTITSESEYNTVRNLNNVNSWSGGSDTVSEGQFAWDAPDAYQIFSDFDVSVGGAVSYFDPSGEPNNSGNLMVINFGNSQAHWDDSGDTNMAYITEFAPIDTTLTYNVTAGTALTITTPTTGLTADNGTAYSLTLATSGGAGSNVFALASGTLNTGLSLNTSTGVISGTTSGTATSNSVTVSVTDANSATVTTNSFTIANRPTPCSTTSTVVGNYTVEKVTTTGSCNWTVPTGVTSIDAFVVGGGGGGSADGGGGGGGGAYQPISGYLVTAGDAITMTVGAGGSAGIWGGNATGTSGGVSSLSKNGSVFATANGGSGGGGGPSGAIGAGGTSTTGFAGGAGGSASTIGGTFGGVGKNGASNYFFGTVAYYGGGGAGGAYGSSATSSTAPCNNAGTAGGLGGGGSAGNRSGTAHTLGCDGTTNTGGGGGAGMAAGPQTSGGGGGSGIAVVRYATDPLNAFPASIGTPVYRMVAENFQTLDSARKQWVDASGNGRHSTAVDGTPSISSVTGNGASTNIRAISGGTTDGIKLAVFNPTTTNAYTLFQVSRYSGATRKRIIDGVPSNWLSGFWSGSAGVSFHSNWLTGYSNNGTTMTNWQLLSDQNTLFRQNGIRRDVTTSGQAFVNQLSVNSGFYAPGGVGYSSCCDERSDFNVAEVLLYNGELTAAQIRQVENYLARTYNLQGYNFDNVALGANGPGTLTAAKSGTVSTGSTSQLALTWTAPQDTTGVSGYKVEYKKASDSTWTTFNASTSGTSTTVTGLDAATSYDTRVTPVDSAAPNRPSISATASTWATSSIALGTMPASPVMGTNYTLTANVTGPSSTTGTVAFMENGAVISACGTTSVLSGVASCTWNPSTFGSRNITATFSGDTAFKESSTVSATAVSVDYGACATSSTTTGRYTYLRVTQSTPCKITTLPSGVESVDVLVVGGGGGGGENVGSGGSGGGGYYAERVAATSSSELTVIVGAGGRAGRYAADTANTAGATTLRDGGNGGATSISWSTNTFTGNGGIGGQTHWSDNICGGGTGIWNNTTAPGGTGSGTGGTALTGGTGGLDGAAAGLNASAGGAGFSNSITGTSTPYGGGGGGGAWGSGIGGTGGNGGGGSGSGSTAGTAGTANTGGGGGGGAAGCLAGGAGGSGVAIVRYANVPTITTQPAAVTKASGQSHTFSVTPSATGALAADFSYQWRKDGTNISGATSSTYTISNPVVADAGTYSVVVKSFGTAGAVSTVTSDDAVLTMNKGTQTITFGTLADRIYGVAAFTISSTNSASLQNTFVSNDTSICTVASPSLSTNTTSATLTVVSNGTCSVTASQAGDINYNTATSATQTFVVTAKALTISGMTAANKEYDRSTTATLNFTNATLNGVVSGDTVTINSAGATGAFSNKTVANGKTVTATGTVLAGAQADRYTLTQPTATANITAKALTVTGITANNKVYDGTTAATSLLIKGSAALSGVIGADAVTLSTASAAGVFANKSKGTGKIITISGLSISGDDAANYTLTQPTTTADITGKVLTVSGITANNRTYDATTNGTSQLVLGSAALVGKEASDTVVLSTSGATATFANKNAEVGKVLTIAGLTISGADADNYTLTQPTTTATILAKELTVTGVTALSRVYDSTTAATALLSLGSAALSGKQGSDTVTLSTASATATFATKTAETGKTVTVAGLTISGADAANYTLTQPTTTANITARELTVSGITANNRVYDRTVNATAQLVLGSAALVGKQGSDTVTLSTASATATFVNRNVGIGKTVTVAGLTITGTDAANYTLTQPTTTATIIAKTLTVTGITANNRVYDRTVDATSQLVTTSAALSGIVLGDTPGLDLSGATAEFATKTVGTAKTVTISGLTITGTDAANYTLTQPTTTANITAKELTVTGVTASDKNYDSTTTAVINTGSAAFSGVVSGDAVTIDVSSAVGNFSSALFGTSKTVTMSGITSSGADSGNYSITQPTTTASISRKTLTVTGITATTRVYNAGVSATSILNVSAAALAGVQGSDSVSLNTASATGTFGDKNVGSGKSIQVAGITISGTAAANYNLVQPTTTGSITEKTLTVTGITASNRVYNSSSSATSVLDTTNATLSGVESGDAVTLSTASIAGSFANKNVGSAKTITITGITIGGTDAANYSLTQPSTSANITAKTLTVTGITANNRIYDASTSATALLVKTSAALSGVETNDTVTLDHSAATASFANKNVANGKAITITGITIGGTDAANYSLTQPSTSANITAKTLTVTGITANNRVYDATTSATALLVKTSAALSGVESGDNVTLTHTSAAATFANKNVADGKAITITGITIGGTDAANYSLTQPSTSANITAKTLTVTGITANNRIYDASTSATALLVKTSAALSGVETNDTVTLDHSAATASFANKNVANGKAITITGITIGGTDAANYSLTQPSTSANITAKTLTVTGITANNRVYDASTSATALLVKTSAALSGVETNDTVTLDHSSANATFANKNIGSGKTITITGITIGGTDAANYSLTQPSTSADMTAKELTVSGITANNRTYDASTTATSQLVLGSAALVGKQGSDIVTLSTASAAGAFANKNIGVGKTITISGLSIAGTDAGNYTLTQPSTSASILAKTITVTGITANNRVYDATTAATSLLIKGSAALSGVESGDTVTLDHSSATATFATKTVGTGKTVTIVGITISGTDFGNYTLTQPATSANITAKTLTVTGITANNRVYNASTSATALLVKTSAALSGVESGDTVTLNHSSATAAFDDKNIGTGKNISIAGIAIAGGDAGNYSLTQPSTSADVTTKTITVTGITATNRVYNASTSATALLVKTSAALSGVESGDTVTLNHSSAAATFANKNVGTGKTISITGITIGGGDAANYSLTQPSTTANITTKALTVTGVAVDLKIFDNTTAASVVTTSAAVVGVESGDAATLDTVSVSGAFADTVVANNKTVQISGLAVAGADASNYTVTQPTTTADMIAASAGLTWNTPSSIVYGTTLSATQLDATTNIAGTFVYTPGAGTRLTAGTHTLSVSFTPTNSAYDPDSATVTIVVTAKTLTVSGLTTTSRVYDSSTAATSQIDTSAAQLNGVVSGDAVTMSTSGIAGSYATKAVGVNKNITVSGITVGGADVNNYALTQPSLTGTITAKPLTVTGITANGRVYDRTTSATALLVKTSAALSGVEASDSVTLNHSAATATFANKSIGVGKNVTIAGITIGGTDASNYTLTQPTTSATIWAETLTITGITAADRVYDATTNATSLLDTTSVALSGVVTNDIVTLSTTNIDGAFASSSIGTNKAITISGNTISGADAGNYVLTQPSAAADITEKELTVSGLTASNKVYDATTAATSLINVSGAQIDGIQGSDNITFGSSSPSAAFGTKTVGNNKTITITGITITGANASNYTLTQPTLTANITSRTLTVSGITATDRVYDRTTGATALLQKSSASLVGIQGSDNVSLNTSSATAAFASKTVSPNKTVTIAGITIGGTDAGNYTLNQPTTTASITAKQLNILGITANNRQYDATSDATSLLDTSSAALDGVIGADIVILSTNAINGVFADKTVDTNKIITITGNTISGGDSANYALVQPTASADITAKSLTISGLTAIDKVYDASASATSLIDKTNAALVGVISGDTVSLSTSSLSATFPSKAVGINRTITTSSNTISGSDAANYSLLQPTLTASITVKTLTVTGITANNRVYDSSTSATSLLVKGSAALSGVMGGDTVTLDHSAATATFATKNIGSNKTVTIAGIAIGGSDAGNYSLTQPATTASITAKNLTVTGITANDRVYNASSSATALLVKSSAALSGVQGSDNVALDHSLASAAFATKNIGASKTVTIDGITISGTDAGNYTLTQPTTTASVTAKTLTVTGITANNRVYDATTDAHDQLVTSSAALSGIVNGDTVSMSVAGINGTFASKTIGTNKPITITGITIGGTDADNYALTQPSTSANITVKTLTVTGITADNKVYNGSTAAALTTTNAAFMGIQGNDTVTIDLSSISGTFANANVNTGIAVAIAGITATGTDAANYAITQPASSANITQASAGLSWSDPSDIVFGPSLTATQLNATASVNGSFVYSPSAGTRLDVGTHQLSVTFTPDSGNYAIATQNVSLTVTRKTLTINAVTSSVTFGTAVTSSLITSGLEGADTTSGVTYTYAGTSTTTYAGSSTVPANAGTYSVTPSALTLASGLTSNYSIAYNAANFTINKAAQSLLTASSAVNSVTYAPSPDEPTVALSTSGGSGNGAVTFAVTSTGGICSISGTTLTAHLAGTCTVVATKAESANYISRDSAAITITVNKSAQEFSFSAIADKTYGDANFTATATATSDLAVTLTAAPSTVCQIVSGLTIQILANGDCTITATQSGDSNYLPATVASSSSGTRTFSIARKTLTVSGTTTTSRIYDATRNATSQVSFASSALVGIVSGDIVTPDFSAATGLFATKNIGVNKSITVAGVTIAGTHASRYTITQPTGLSANVNAQTVTVDGVTVPTRAYNTTTVAQLSTGAYNFTGIVTGDAVTLDDSAYVATFATAGAATMKVVTISGLALAGNDAQNYTLTQPLLQGDIVKAAATIAFASPLNATFNNTPRPLQTTTTPGALSVIPSYSGTGATTYGPSASAPTNAGAYSLVATINDVNYEGSNTSAWTINKQTVIVNATQSALTKVFNGTTHTVPVSTSPTGKNLAINYTGINGTVYNSSFAPTNAGTYRVTGTVVEANFDGVTIQTLTVDKAAQSAITFVSETGATFGTPHRLIAVGGSGSGTLTYERDGGSCTVDASTGVVTPTGTGQCTFHAERATSSNYLSASSSNHTISVAKGSQTISFTSIVPSTTAKDSTYAPSAAATSGLTPVISIATGLGSVCNFNNGVVTFLASGVCEIVASHPGDSNWLAATSMKQIVEVGKLSQAITFPQPANYELGDPDFVLDASSSSGLPVTSSVTSGASVCSINSSGIVSILSIGDCTIEVTQSGDSVFSVASTVARTITVLPALPSAPHISSISAGDGTVTVGYIAPSTNGGSALVSYSVVATSPTAPTLSNTNCSTSTLTCTLVGLVNGASYSINVTAFNSRGAGAVSQSAEVLIPAPTLLAVQNVSGKRSNTTLNVTWEDPNTYGDGVFTRYDVSIRERGGSFGNPVTVQSYTARSTSVSHGSSGSSWSGVIRSLTTVARSAQFSNLDPSKLYETKIVTITSVAAVEASTNTASALVMALANPSAPRELTVDAPTATSARVSWTTPLSDGGSAVQSYTVTSNIGQCQASNTLATSCLVSNVQSGDSLTISVRASNSVGNSIATTTTYVVPSAPGAPTINIIATTTTAATVTWRAPQSDGGRTITAYSALAQETANPGNTFRCTSSGLSCVMNGLKPAINYTFKVRALNSVGSGAYSATAAFDMARPVTSDWTTYRNAATAASASALSLPPAPARVKVQSLSGGRRTQVTAVRATKDAAIPVTYALISIRTRTNKLLARIKVLVDPANPTTSVSVPYASSKVLVSVQFANDIGISSGGPAGINIAEGNTFEWTTVSNETRIKGTQVKGDLFFARGKSTLTYAMQKNLKKMATTVKARGGIVYVSGFAQKGELNSAWMLEPLARARAEAVAKYLAKIGVRQWITFHGTAGSAFNGWEPVSGRQVVIATVMPDEI
jgi:outer membrane protein OmpA-like peptidoglycan-associated protein